MASGPSAAADAGFAARCNPMRAIAAFGRARRSRRPDAFRRQEVGASLADSLAKRFFASAW
jgi:hypothetical protein